MSIKHGITRREAVTRLATGLVALSLAPYATITHAERQQATDAPLAWSQFYLLSQRLTDRPHLDPALSARYFLALNQCFPDAGPQLAQLYALCQQHTDSQSLYQAAVAAGQETMCSHILHAWYTGTAGPSAAGGNVLVAYRDALMYQPVSDALVIPTWCSKGPLWWTGLPPGVTREPSVPAINPVVSSSAAKDL